MFTAGQSQKTAAQLEEERRLASTQGVKKQSPYIPSRAGSSGYVGTGGYTPPPSSPSPTPPPGQPRQVPDYYTPEYEQKYMMSGGYAPYLYPETYTSRESGTAIKPLGGYDFQWSQDPETGEWMMYPEAMGRTPQATGGAEPTSLQQGFQEQYVREDGTLMKWSPIHGDYIEAGYAGQQGGGIDQWQQAQLDWDREQYMMDEQYRRDMMQQSMQPEPMSEYQQMMGQYQQQQSAWEKQMAQQQYGLQQQQINQEQQNYLAQLSAQPINWLQYSQAAGESPAVQPWMLPLMSQQYPELQAGQQLPGWGEGASGMPEMTRPSAQYWSRMGPTSQQQYLGYKQYRTGSSPEESQWRMWGQAPSGQRQGLYWNK